MSEVPANPFAAPDGRPPDPASALTPSSDFGSPYGQPGAGVPAYGTPSYESPYGAPSYGPYSPPPYGTPGGAYPPPPYGTPGGAYPPPSYGQPGGAYPPPYGPPYAVQESSNGLAIASMVVGIVSVVLCAFFVPAVVGLVLGIVALSQTKNGRSGGRGMAITGVVTSGVSLVLAVVFIIFGLVSDDDTYDDYGSYSTQGQTGQVTGHDPLAGLVAA